MFSILVWLSRVPSSGRVVLLVLFAARGRRCLLGLSCCFAPCVQGCALLFRGWYSACDLCALTFLRFSGSVCVKTIVFKTERLFETPFRGGWQAGCRFDDDLFDNFLEPSVRRKVNVKIWFLS